MTDQEFYWIPTLTENNGPYQGNQAELSYDFTIKREVGNIETLKSILRID